MTIKLLIAEDHEHTRQGLVYGLSKNSSLEIVGEASNGQEAVELAQKLKPDMILMDIMMPLLNGVKAVQQIKDFNSDIKIIMLTSYSEKEKVISSFNSGANAYCMKNILIEDLVNVIKTVMDGSIWVDAGIAGYIMEVLQSKHFAEEQHKENNAGLTNREKEILKLIAEGMNNKDIAEKLFLSLHTVKNHVRSIIHKLAVSDRTQAAILALKENLI